MESIGAYAFVDSSLNSVVFEYTSWQYYSNNEWTDFDVSNPLIATMLKRGNQDGLSKGRYEWRKK